MSDHASSALAHQFEDLEQQHEAASLGMWIFLATEVMFFGGVDPDARALDGGAYPHPALVFRVTRRELFVRALERDERPTGETPLKTAPYWNCDAAGRVCLGSMRVPDQTTVESISDWQAGFFRSRFTHANGSFPHRIPD